MSAKTSVHHSHQHAVSLSTHNTHATGQPLQKSSARTSRATSFLITELGTTPVSRSRVNRPPYTGDKTARKRPSFTVHLLREVCLR
jgi:hypothetical protein